MKKMNRTCTRSFAFVIVFSLLMSFGISELKAVVSLPPASVRPGEAIQVIASGYQETASSWVGFYKAGAADTSYISYRYINQLTDGVYSVIAPKELGNYEFRFFRDDGYTKTGTSSTINVIQYTPSFFLNVTQVEPNEMITVSYSGAPVFADAWIGFYQTGAEDTVYRSFQYTGGVDSGTYSVIAPDLPGSYEFRLFLDFGYTRIGISSPVLVTEFQPTLIPSDYQFLPGTKASISFTGGSTEGDAWIGLYEVSAEDKKYLSYQYTGGKAEGSIEYTLPMQEGYYEFRMFKDFGYQKLATSMYVQVTKSATALVEPEIFESGARLAWPAYYGALGYRLYRSTVEGQQGISVTDFYITSTSYADVNADTNMTYYYTVRPVLREAAPLDGISEEVGEILRSFVVHTQSTGYKPDKEKSFIILQIDNQMMSVAGSSSEIDPGRGTTPLILSGRTMVPIRAIVEAMGGSVGWDPNAQKITLTARGNVVEMWIGRKELTINGVVKTIDVAPVISNGRTYVPVRFAAENLDCKVEWVQSTREAVIVYDNK